MKMRLFHVYELLCFQNPHNGTRVIAIWKTSRSGECQLLTELLVSNVESCCFNLSSSFVALPLCPFYSSEFDQTATSSDIKWNSFETARALCTWTLSQKWNAFVADNSKHSLFILCRNLNELPEWNTKMIKFTLVPIKTNEIVQLLLELSVSSWTLLC